MSPPKRIKACDFPASQPRLPFVGHANETLQKNSKSCIVVTNLGVDGSEKGEEDSHNNLPWFKQKLDFGHVHLGKPLHGC